MGSLLVMNDKRPRFRSDRPQLAGSRKLRMVSSHVAEPGFCDATGQNPSAKNCHKISVIFMAYQRKVKLNGTHSTESGHDIYQGCE
jgi:hypothetical protein